MYVISVIIAGLWVTGKAATASQSIAYAYSSLGLFVTIFQCRPVSGAWNFSYLYASSAVNVATDILLCVLPLPHLWRLNMPLKQRLILCVLLAGGARYVHLL
jgi:hypothetical protein